MHSQHFDRSRRGEKRQLNVINGIDRRTVRVSRRMSRAIKLVTEFSIFNREEPRGQTHLGTEDT